MTTLRLPGPGLSPELIRHHSKLHRQQCANQGVIETVCPCLASIAICCGTCRHPIFIAAFPDRPLCLHAAEAMDASHPNWWGARP